ncbi:uroporphyrinogen decarboxylase-like [Tropilaelaps mercedesae]|uniref:Uroporphyrinogen decarboxylase n=1 Tax=Tropilaelaps mercedesae TaxID=418985 RepID=A0A1V9XNX9_9ACAR|nr:uroporphyrinogen decarboxylase-like [Tropilaelaps mercedesae]
MATVPPNHPNKTSPVNNTSPADQKTLQNPANSPDSANPQNCTNPPNHTVPSNPVNPENAANAANPDTSTEFPQLKNDRILRAARGEPVDTGVYFVIENCKDRGVKLNFGFRLQIPVWVMRQAGRYLPEFMETRKTHTFFEMCQRPEIACEITLQPIRRFNVDAAIIFSDILVIPQAMGMSLEMRPGEGPVFSEPLKNVTDVIRLKDINVNRDLKYVMEAITATRRALEGKVPLFGFSGAPWTLMCYMVEGKGSKTQSNAKRWLYCHPVESQTLLGRLEEIIVEYMVAQVQAGAQLLQLFDTNAGYLSEQTFLRFVKPGYLRIAKGIREKLQGTACPPLCLFPKDAHFKLAHLRDAGYDVIGVDWAVPPEKAREALGDGVTIQGNLDPCALYAEDETIRELAREMVARFGQKRYIANLGHGMYPDMDPNKLRVFIETIHSIKQT